MPVTLRMTFQPSGSTAAFTIEVPTVNFDAEQTLNLGSASGGAGAGKVTFNPFSFTKRPDSHSPELWSRLCSGTAFQKVSLDVSASGATTPFFNFTMGLVAIKTISFSASEDDDPRETVTLEYGQSAYTVTPQNPDGTPGKPLGSGWDRVKNMAEDPLKVGIA